MPVKNNIIGKRFGRLKVIRYAGDGKWHCMCVCGNTTILKRSAFTCGKTKSCGCYNRDRDRSKDRRARGPDNGNYKHGGRQKYPSEYSIWKAMKRRCDSPNQPHYYRYGGRGISVCEEWRNDFMSFYNHVGPRPSMNHSIDRIDTLGNYRPGNVRWATAKEQARNSRHNRMITYDGKTMCMIEWAEHTGLTYATVQQRLDRGWSIRETMTLPSGTRR